MKYAHSLDLYNKLATVQENPPVEQLVVVALERASTVRIVHLVMVKEPKELDAGYAMEQG